jgi:hypothetical protein
MFTARPGTIALHVQAAKQLLEELDRQANVAIQALGRDNGEEFFAAVEERDRLLAELGAVADTLAQERAWSSHGSGQQETTPRVFTEVAYAAAAALESHERLVAHAQAERDRLASALERNARPDGVALQYAGAADPARPTFSVTG